MSQVLHVGAGRTRAKVRGHRLTLTVGAAIGLLIGYLLGFTHGTPTPENSSPPPEAFDYPFGILLGLGMAAVARAAAPFVWRSMHRGRR